MNVLHTLVLVTVAYKKISNNPHIIKISLIPYAQHYQIGRGVVTTIMVSDFVCESGPAWSICISQKGGDLDPFVFHRKVEIYQDVINLFPPVPMIGSTRAVHVFSSQCGNATRSILVCAQYDPLVTERWDSITVLLTRFHQCWRLVQKRRSMYHYVCVMMHVKDP